MLRRKDQYDAYCVCDIAILKAVSKRLSNRSLKKNKEIKQTFVKHLLIFLLETFGTI